MSLKLNDMNQKGMSIIFSILFKDFFLEGGGRVVIFSRSNETEGLKYIRINKNEILGSML